MRSPGLGRGPAASGASQSSIQPLTWATLPRVAQVLGFLALVHLLAVLVASVHSHSSGGGLVFFPLAHIFSQAPAQKAAAPTAGVSTEQVLDANEEAALAALDAETREVQQRDEEAGRQLPDPATNATHSETVSAAGGEERGGGEDGAAAALKRTKEDLSPEKQHLGERLRRKRAELDRIIAERRQRLAGGNSQKAEAEAQAKGQVETLQEQQKQAAEGEGQAPPAPQSTEQKVPSPPGLLSALWGQGDPRPLSERLSEVVVDWVELRGDRPVPQPKVDYKAIDEQKAKEQEAEQRAEAERKAKQARGVPDTVVDPATTTRRSRRHSKRDRRKSEPEPRPAASCEDELPIPTVAMMFLTRGHLHHEGTWTEWFRMAAGLLPRALVQSKGCEEEAMARIASSCAIPEGNATVIQQQRLFQIYIHVGLDNAEFDGFPPDSIWHGLNIPERVKVEWGRHSMVDATRALLRNALENPLNQKFILLSEAGIPLYPPGVMYHQLITESKSRLMACVTPTWERHVHRWIDRMRSEHLSKENWRKSSQWFAATREHARIFVDDTIIDGIFRKDCYPTREDGWWRDCFGDEHYFPTLLAALGREDETDCHGFLTNVDWSRGGGHPRSYLPQEVGAARLRLLRLPNKECGYPAAIRTGKDQFVPVAELREDTCKATVEPYAPLGPQCPLLARKFPPDTAEAVLRLLSDCKNRLKILYAEDCQQNLQRQLLAADEPWLLDGSLHEAGQPHAWQLGMQALASDAALLPDEAVQELLAAAGDTLQEATGPANQTLADASRHFIDLLSAPRL